MRETVIVFNIILILLSSCKQSENSKNTLSEPKRQQPDSIGFKFINAKQWLTTPDIDSRQKKIAYAANRTDSANFAKMDSVIIPIDFTGDIEFYLPFPFTVPVIKDIHKIIYFSYPTQSFATYEKGILTYTGPTNMGRQKDTTPNGLFYTNWKAEETISTFNDEWELRWNFNIANEEGIGWHQYSLPGYPASHSCLRLQEDDAKNLFNWADQWELKKDSVLVKGTPVIVFGAYNFNAPKPWLQLVTNPTILNIEPAEIERQTTPYLQEIISEQKNREAFRLKNP